MVSRPIKGPMVRTVLLASALALAWPGQTIAQTPGNIPTPTFSKRPSKVYDCVIRTCVYSSLRNGSFSAGNCAYSGTGQAGARCRCNLAGPAGYGTVAVRNVCSGGSSSAR